MATITSYDTLLQAVQDAAEDDSAEFVAFIPDAIDLAEERLFRELDLMDLELKATGATVNNVYLIPKPAGYQFANYFSIVSGGRTKILKKRRDDFIQDYWPDLTVTGEPKYYSDSSATNFIVVPTPSTNYAYTIKYSAKPTKLSVSNETNYYTDNCQDMLYYATMVEMSKFMKAWQEIAVWDGVFTSSVQDWNLNALRKRRDDGETPQNPDSGPNTLIHTAKSKA